MEYHVSFCFLILCLFFFKQSTPLECFECSKTSSISFFSNFSQSIKAACGEFNNSLIVTCSSHYDTCVTLSKTTQNGSTGELHGCGVKADCAAVDGARTSREGAIMQCSSCNTDLCNGKMEKSERLSCYECNEGLDGFLKNIRTPCNNFEDKLVATCPLTSKVCNKVQGEMADISGSIHYCGTTKADCDKMQSYKIGPLNIPVKCYSCENNKCNSATSLVMSFALYIIPMLTIVKL